MTIDSTPLVVDLDGTLIRTDLLFESCFLFLRQEPHKFFMLFIWLLRGKSVLKEELASRVSIDVSQLPYEQSVVDFIHTERERGRPVVLATASHRTFAQQITGYLGCFESLHATEQKNNLSAGRKRDRLIERYGEHGFDYIGNSSDDLKVWSASRTAYIVNASRTIEQQARVVCDKTYVLHRISPTLGDFLKMIRLHQWVKNILLFVPLLTAHLYSDPELLVTLIGGFLLFGLCASSVYILNDLFDMTDDRCHSVKRKRPIASGIVSIQTAIAVFTLLIITAFGFALLWMPALFVVGMSGYFVLTLFYSTLLKRYMVLDVITLAALYTLRIIVGAIAIDVSLSFWLLAFSMFIFLSLAMVKRYAELHEKFIASSEVRGRDYRISDMQMVASLGSASGYIAVLVLALYINDPVTIDLYHRTESIWLACPLLLVWISRIWMLVHRGEMNEDPVVFAIHDRFSWLIGFLFVAAFWGAM